MTGLNAILQFNFDGATGTLTPNSTPRAIPQTPDGPRHICVNPNLDVVYSSNEQGCSVTAYNFDSSQGTLSPFQTLSTLPKGYTDRNTCSQIQITSSGKFLYTPNRGHNSIACFWVEEFDGRLTSIGQVPTEPVPRAFSLDPTGKYLFAAGLETGRLAAYRVNGASGLLEPLRVYPVGQHPMWVLITEL